MTPSRTPGSASHTLLAHTPVSDALVSDALGSAPHASGNPFSGTPANGVHASSSRVCSPPAPSVSAAVTAGDRASSPTVCQHCGGSGMLRLGDQRYRTCLECLGQGQRLRQSLGTLFAPKLSVAAAASGAG